MYGSEPGAAGAAARAVIGGRLDFRAELSLGLGIDLSGQADAGGLERAIAELMPFTGF
jgi:hypothetical protein